MNDNELSRLLQIDPENTIKHNAAEFDVNQRDRCCVNWPTWMLEWASESLTPLQFAYCCQRDARMALDWFGNRLEPQLFDACIEADPESALSRVLDLLSDAQFGGCIRSCPSAAIFNPDAVSRMTWQQFDYCIRSAPEDALRFVPWLLTNQQLDFCCRYYPCEAVRLAASYLTVKQVAYFYEQEPQATIEHAGHRLPFDLQRDACRKFPELSLRHIGWRLSDIQRMHCISRAPWSILEDYIDVLKTNELLMLVSDYRIEVRDLIEQSPWHEIVALLQPHTKLLDQKTACEVANAQEYRRQQTDGRF